MVWCIRTQAMKYHTFAIKRLGSSVYPIAVIFKEVKRTSITTMTKMTVEREIKMNEYITVRVLLCEKKALNVPIAAN